MAALAVLGAAAAAYFVGLPWLNAKLWKTEVAVTEIAMVSPSQASVELTTTGYVTAQTTSKIGAKIPGRVAEVKVKEGDEVKAGDLLIVLDDADQRAAIRAAESRVAAARARVATARATLAETEQSLAREKALAKAGAGPQAIVDDLEARVRSLKAQVAAAEAETRAAQAEVASLQQSLTETKIYAPISGTVVAKPVEVGEVASPTNLEPLVELSDFATLVVETDVPEGRLGQVKIDGPTEIVLDAYPGKRFRGRTLEIGRKVNRAKATITVKVAFVDPMDGVLPDMAARVSFLQKELDAEAMKEPPKLVVPSAAITERDGAKVVFVIDQGVVRAVPVSTGEAMANGFVLLEGPPAGTRVVQNPGPKLATGQKIKEKSN